MSSDSAAVVWISAHVDVDQELVKATLRSAVDTEKNLRVTVSQRSAPAATLVHASYHDSDELLYSEDAAYALAAALAKALAVRAYALHGLVSGGGSKLLAAAYSEEGKQRWEQYGGEGSENDDPAFRRSAAAAAKKLGMRVAPADGGDDEGTIAARAFPYWRMMAELEDPKAEELLTLFTTPVLEPHGEWTRVDQFTLG